jgi:hypothetical protein
MKITMGNDDFNVTIEDAGMDFDGICQSFDLAIRCFKALGWSDDEILVGINYQAALHNLDNKKKK